MLGPHWGLNPHWEEGQAGIFFPSMRKEAGMGIKDLTGDRNGKYPPGPQLALLPSLATTLVLFPQGKTSNSLLFFSLHYTYPSL